MTNFAYDELHMNKLVDEISDPFTFSDLSKYLKKKPEINGFNLELLLFRLRENNITIREQEREESLTDVLSIEDQDPSKSDNHKSASKRYFDRISNHDLLSSEEETELFSELERSRDRINQILKSTHSFYKKLRKNWDRIQKNDSSIKSVLNIGRSERISDDEKENYRHTISSVLENTENILENGMKYDFKSVSDSSFKISMLFNIRREIFNEFKSLEFDQTLLNETRRELSEEGFQDSSWSFWNQKMQLTLQFLRYHRSFYRDKIALSNLRLVTSQINQFLNRGLDYMDLIQEGNLGLYQAIKKFDYRKGYKFSTYATWWIRQAMQRAIYEKSSTIRIPIHRREQMAKVFNAKSKLFQKLNREPTNEEIADKLNWKTTLVDNVMKVQDKPLSLEADDDDNDERSIKETVDDPNSTSFENSILSSEIKNELAKFINQLSWRKRQVVRMRFGLDNSNPMTLKEIGKTLGVTKERARQLRNEALETLSQRAEGSKLEHLTNID